jgi:serine/threonine protein kinase
MKFKLHIKMGCCSSSTPETCLLIQRGESQESLQSFRQQIRTSASIRESFTIIKTLGSGSLGSVFLVKDKRTGLERAAKELVKSLMDDKALESFFAELFILKHLVNDI